MQNYIIGVAAFLVGATILAFSVRNEGPQDVGAYRGGQIAGMVLGGLAIAGGVHYVIKGLKGTGNRL